MKVERYYINNFRNISQEFDLDVRGRHVIIKAGNKKGKTSFLDGLFTIASKKLPKGMTNALPSNLVNADGLVKGAKSFFQMKGDNQEIISVEAEINQNDEVRLSLKSTEKKGSYAAGRSPRAVLDELVGVCDLDLMSLFNMQPADQVAFIKKLMPELDFTQQEKQLKEDRATLAYNEKRAKELDAITQELRFDKKLAEKEEVNAAELVAKSQQAHEHNNIVKALMDSIDSEEALRKAKFEKTEELREAIASLERQMEGHKASILITRKKLEDPQYQLIDISEIQREMTDIHETNQKIRDAKNGMAKYDELKEVEDNILLYKTRVSNHVAAMRDMMAKANFPVQGLTFDENGLYLNGLPFRKDVQNTAELVVAALQLQVPLLNKAQFMRFRTDGLDKNTLQGIIDWADRHDYQLFMEHVDPEGGEIQIEFIEPLSGERTAADYVQELPYTEAESVKPEEKPSVNTITTDAAAQSVAARAEVPESIRYATAKQKEEIIRLLNNVVITRQEKTKMLLNINKLDEERAASSIEKLRAVIKDRESQSANF